MTTLNKPDLFCIASGPSLTAADCELVRQAGIKTVAVNSTWELVPWCDYIYAGDPKWWRQFHNKIKGCDAERWTCQRNAHILYGINLHVAGGGYNSGMRAIQFGIKKCFKRIALLGYDCSLKNGVHWHGEHPEPLKNPDDGKVEKWHSQFAKVAAYADEKGVQVINCSRYTELECFERIALERLLGLGDKC